VKVDQTMVYWIDENLHVTSSGLYVLGN